MSIDYLLDLDREINFGKDYFACPGPGRNQWIISRSMDELRTVAKRAANLKKLAVSVVRLTTPHEAVAGENFLVPVRIEEAGARGEPQIQWSTVETREAAELMRDLRRGGSPYFAMQVQEEIEPDASA